MKSSDIQCNNLRSVAMFYYIAHGPRILYRYLPWNKMTTTNFLFMNNWITSALDLFVELHRFSKSIVVLHPSDKLFLLLHILIIIRYSQTHSYNMFTAKLKIHALKQKHIIQLTCFLTRMLLIFCAWNSTKAHNLNQCVRLLLNFFSSVALIWHQQRNSHNNGNVSVHRLRPYSA